jgi:hypothetical protein
VKSAFPFCLVLTAALFGCDPHSSSAKAMNSNAVDWKALQFEAAHVAKLNSIQGFITELPVHWGQGENNHFKYPSMLVVDAGPMPGSGSADTAVASNRPTDNTAEPVPS